MVYRFSLILLLAASPAMAQAVSDPTREALPRELMLPQPLEQTPTLRAPGPVDNLIAPPESAVSERLSEPRADQPDDAAAGKAEMARESRPVPEPPQRPSPSQRAEERRAPPTRATTNRTASTRAARRSAPRRVTASRPLPILPPAARETAAAPAPAEPARAYAPVAAAPAPPWPFRLRPVQPQFDVPGGWW
jgi:hypothetical protein